MFQPMIVTLLVLTGVGVALLGSIKVPLARRLAIDEARVGGLVSTFGFTIIPAMFCVGFLADAVGKQPIVIGGSVLLAVSLLLLGQARTYPASVVAVALLSAAWSSLINVLNAMIPAAFPRGMAYASNLANVFFGIGAFLAPLAIAFLTRRSSLAVALRLIAAVAVVPAIMAMNVDFSAIKPPPVVGGGTSTSLADPLLWLCAVGMLFYGPLEAALGAWTTTYLGEKGVREATASTLLSAFWLAFMLARLVTAFTLPAGCERQLVLALALACAAVLAGMVFCRGRATAVALVMAAGFIFGPVFPTLMAILLGHFSPGVYGRMVGLFFAVGGIGGTTIPILIGAYARRTSVQRGFLVAVASALAFSALAIAILLKA
jgi:fucose permease